MRSVLWVLAVCGLGACSDDGKSRLEHLDASTPAKLSCDDAYSEVSSRVNGPGITSLAGCNSDADCTSFIPNFQCAASGTQIGACPVPIASASLDAGLAYLSSVEAELCPQITGRCSALGKCRAVVAQCVNHQCVRGDAGMP